MCGPHKDEDKMSKLSNTKRAPVRADAGCLDEVQKTACPVDNALTKFGPSESATASSKSVAPRRPSRSRPPGVAGPPDLEVASPAVIQPATPAPKGKIGALIELLRRADGATIAEMMAATGWQAHSVRGAMSGSIKKALGLEIVSIKTDDQRVYRIIEGAST